MTNQKVPAKPQPPSLPLMQADLQGRVRSEADHR
jgi:hypothetical protein